MKDLPETFQDGVENTTKLPIRLGNRNALKNGLHRTLAIGGLPSGMTYVRRLVNEFRRAVEAATLATCGEVDLFHSAVVQTCCRHEQRSLLAQRWLRTAQGLTIDQQLALSREIGQASEARDRCLRLLGLDRCDAADLFAGIDTTSANSPAPASGAQTTADGSEAVDDVERSTNDSGAAGGEA